MLYFLNQVSVSQIYRLLPNDYKSWETLNFGTFYFSEIIIFGLKFGIIAMIFAYLQFETVYPQSEEYIWCL